MFGTDQGNLSVGDCRTRGIGDGSGDRRCVLREKHTRKADWQRERAKPQETGFHVQLRILKRKSRNRPGVAPETQPSSTIQAAAPYSAYPHITENRLLKRVNSAVAHPPCQAKNARNGRLATRIQFTKGSGLIPGPPAPASLCGVSPGLPASPEPH